MRYLAAALAALAVALASSGTALGGGWATVSVDPLPSGVGPGEPWNPEITFLQHGDKPITGIHPTITITDPTSGDVRTFSATETKQPGVYAASVVFPTAGGWNVAVESDWWGEARLTFGPVEIDGTPPAAGDSPGFPVVPAAAVVGALLLAAAGGLGIARLRRLSPAR